MKVLYLLLLLIFLLLQVFYIGASLAQNSLPDVIVCGGYFYYIGFSSIAVSRYYAVTGDETKIQSYQVTNEILTSKSGSQITSDCLNQTILQLWNSNRAFRIQNKGLTPNPSILNAQGIPDAIKCENKILKIYIFLKAQGIFYYNSQDNSYGTVTVNSQPHNQDKINCLQKPINQLISDGQAFNFVTEQVQAEGQSYYSMTKKYPDALSCANGAVFFVYFISQDQSEIVYRADFTDGLQQISFSDGGRTQNPSKGGQVKDCASKSLSTLINQGIAFNLNNPLLICPDDITTMNQVVRFKITAVPKLTVVSNPESGSSFSIGRTTVNVSATDTDGLNLQCTFKVNRLPDTLAPKLTCPQNIEQLEPVVDFEATATDNLSQSVKITYDKDPGSAFEIGKTTVKVTATDDAGNQAFCTLDVNILPDTVAPELTCPKNIEQLEPVVDFEATATDNVSQPVKITYDKDPGSTFETGKTTVKVTAKDASGNQAFCIFDVNIIAVSNQIEIDLYIIQEDQSTSSSMIGIILGSILAAVAAGATIIIILLCKKHKKVCFKPKQKRQQKYEFPKSQSSQSAESKSAKRLQW